jgi:type IV secretion system protein VirD4
LILISGCSPIRAKKARYFEDERFRDRVVPPAQLGNDSVHHDTRKDDWSDLRRPFANIDAPKPIVQPKAAEATSDPANSGIRREPALSQHEEVAPEPGPAKAEFEFADDETDDEVQRATTLRKQAADLARQAAMDPGDDLGM